MDLIGTISLIFDIQWVTHESVAENSLSQTNHGSILRVARLGRIAPRVSRLMRALMIFSKLFYRSKNVATNKSSNGDNNKYKIEYAHSMSEKVSAIVSRRVAACVILGIIFASLIAYYSSPYSSININGIGYLDSMNKLINADGTLLQIDALVNSFYDCYKPSSATPLSLTIANYRSWTWGDEFKIRSDFVTSYSSGNVTGVFNNSRYLKTQASGNILISFLVIVLLLFFTSSFDNALRKVIIIPLDKLISSLQQSCQGLLEWISAFEDISGESEKKGDIKQNITSEEQLSYPDDISEIELLDFILQKLSRLAGHTSTNYLERFVEANRLDKNIQKWLTSEYSNERNRSATALPSPRNQQPRYSFCFLDSSATEVFTEDSDTVQLLLESWELDVLEYSLVQQFYFVHYVFRKTNCFTRFNIDETTFSCFVKSVSESYWQNSYHNFSHGVDVCHTIYRFLCLTYAEYYLNKLEIFGGLIAALGHDIGHIGLNNAYLIKTRHELAIIYNDISPLENMHCVELFEIISKEESNILKHLNPKEWAEIRKLIIASILQTDMVKHFKTVSDIEVLAEMYGEIMPEYFNSFDAIAIKDPSVTTSKLPAFFKEPEKRAFLVEIFLHAADISNPIKSTSIALRWAVLVTEEFFNQGEREKNEGLEISPMMDRSKVNLNTLQINFIEFVVSPLYAALLKLFPPMESAAQNLLHNQKFWINRRFQEISEEVPAVEFISEDTRLESNSKNEKFGDIELIEQGNKPQQSKLSTEAEQEISNLKKRFENLQNKFSSALVNNDSIVRSLKSFKKMSGRGK